jgi:CxxC-x17-CxxC domain-containing protein
MGNFSRGSSGRGGFGGRPGGFRGKPGGFGGRSSGGFRGRDSGRPIEHHNAICSKCGAACQVPFRPTGTKPVLCAKCFREGGSARSMPSHQPGVSPEQLKQINIKLDRILTILQDLEIDEGDDEVTDDADEDEDTEETKPIEKAKPKGPSKAPAAGTDDDDEDDEEEEGTDEVEETDEDEAKSEDIKE